MKTVFSSVNEWLKFSEAKNAALVALCSAGIWGILQLLKDSNKLEEFRIVLLCILLTLIISLVISLFSFIPQKTNIDKKKLPIENPMKLNLLFFRHISKFSPQDYLEALYQKYGQHENYSYCPSYEKDLANQIVINAEITMTKTTRFKQSISILFFGIIASTIGLIIIA